MKDIETGTENASKPSRDDDWSDDLGLKDKIYYSCTCVNAWLSAY